MQGESSMICYIFMLSPARPTIVLSLFKVFRTWVRHLFEGSSLAQSMIPVFSGIFLLLYVPGEQLRALLWVASLLPRNCCWTSIISVPAYAQAAFVDGPFMHALLCASNYSPSNNGGSIYIFTTDVGFKHPVILRRLRWAQCRCGDIKKPPRDALVKVILLLQYYSINSHNARE